ncbi:MAG: DUF1080 domain-containing protein [Parabacteroides sp.]|nr:DUF1080 domain-containing protein [Parabacteroides sp.]
MKKILLLISLVCAFTAANAQQGGHVSPAATEWYTPQPPKVQPGDKPGNPPSDAIVLFDGKDLSKWVTPKDGKFTDPTWKIEDGAMVIVPGGGDVQTKEYFGDCQLHIEFKTPKAGPKNTLQMKGNSGIFLQSIYEVQVLDGEDNPTYVNGMVGSVYKQQAPLANAFTGTEKWQVYDIYYKAPRFTTDGALESPAMVTVVLNGILVQNNYILKGNTPYIGFPTYKAHGRLPLLLQDHGVAVAYRNIWIRNL